MKINYIILCIAMLETLITLLSLLTPLFLHGAALPQNLKNNSAVTVTQSDDNSCSSGQVTNVVVQGGVAGPQGEKGPTGLTGPPGPPGGGVSYTRWGRTTCPTTEGTQLVYEGAVVGSHKNEGGSAEYLCLHNEPEFLQITPGQQSGRTQLYGTEYKPYDPPALSSILNHDAPCSVCYTASRSTKITVPGRISCPSSWTKEYHGYLMTDRVEHNVKVPLCVDIDAESVAGSAVSTSTSVLLFVEATCTGIKCPPYSDGAEITCVVCTK